MIRVSLLVFFRTEKKECIKFIYREMFIFGHIATYIHSLSCLNFSIFLSYSFNDVIKVFVRLSKVFGKFVQSLFLNKNSPKLLLKSFLKLTHLQKRRILRRRILRNILRILRFYVFYHVSFI